MSEQTNQRTGLTINWLQIAGGALAAITSAVALAGLKSFGPYGTLVGAAVGSIAASTAAAVYNHYLNASRDKLAEAARRARERRTGPVPTPQDDHPDPVDPPVDEAPDPDAGPTPTPDPVPRKKFRARHAVLLGAAAFVLSVGGIFVYEQASGTSVAAERGGATTSETGVSSGILGNPVTQSPSTPVTTESPTSTSTDSATETSTATETSSTDDPTATSDSTSTGTSTGTDSPTSSASSSSSSSSSSSASSDAAAEPGATAEDAALAEPTGTPTTAP